MLHSTKSTYVRKNIILP